jgi:hypothetical protein
MVDGAIILVALSVTYLIDFTAWSYISPTNPRLQASINEGHFSERMAFAFAWFVAIALISRSAISVVVAMAAGALIGAASIIVSSYDDLNDFGGIILFFSLVAAVYGANLGLLFVGVLRLLSSKIRAPSEPLKSGWIPLSISLLCLIPLVVVRSFAYFNGA